MHSTVHTLSRAFSSHAGYRNCPFLFATTVTGTGIESASVLCYSPIAGPDAV